jgi:group I intron endonuclease
MANEKTGIYQIKCGKNGHIYIGSSRQIYGRWSAHRYVLRKGTSTCVILQHAWSRHGEDCFTFTVIEECPADQLEAREQFYIDLLKPKFNSITDVKRRFSAEAHAKIAASLRARAALITHCPYGHEYTEANTHINKKGKRICRACAAERVSKIYADETPEQREARRQYARLSHENNRAERLEKQRIYMASHKAQKSEYDRLHRKEFSARRLERRHAETPEQREHRLQLKRASYQRCKDATQGA